MKCVSNENIHSGLVAEFPRICIYTQQKVSRKVNPSTFFHTLTNFHFLFTVTLTRCFHQPKTRYFIKVHIYHPLLPELLERMNTKTNVNAIPYNYDIPCHNKKKLLVFSHDVHELSDFNKPHVLNTNHLEYSSHQHQATEASDNSNNNNNYSLNYIYLWNDSKHLTFIY